MMLRVTSLAVVAHACTLAAASQNTGRIRPTGYTYSHHEWLAPKWGDLTGRTLTDGEAGRGKKPVIFKGPAIHIDFQLPGRHAVERVVLHSFRGNQRYKLTGFQIFARQLGNYVPITKDMGGYGGRTMSSAYVYEFKGLNATTDSIRVQVLTGNQSGLTEVEIYGRPVREQTASSHRPPVALTAGDDLVAREGDLDGSKRMKVLIENRFVQLLIDPQRGGIVESVFHKSSGKQLTYCLPGAPKFPGGLLEDHNWDPYYSYAEFPYTADVKRDGDRAVVVLRGRGREGMYRFTEIVKTLTLHRDRASLDVGYGLKNDPSSMTEFTYAWWIHNCLAVMGEPNTYFMPSKRGVRSFPWKPKTSGFDTWAYDVTRGWTGMLGESGVGAVVEMDFRSLNCLYACFMPESTTLEWRLTRIPIAAGESLKTEARFVFVDGLKSLAGSKHGLVGSIDVEGKARPDAEIGLRVAVFSDRARLIEAALSAQRVAGGEAILVDQATAKLRAGDTSTWQWRARLPAGTYRLLLSTRSDGAISERALVVGKPDVPYSQEPEAERIGLAGPPGRTPGKLPRHDLSFEIETPHEKWAKPLPGGPIRAFILVDVGEQREIVELAQRLDLEVETVKIRSALQGANYRYRGDRSIASLADAQERILEILLKSKFDVFVIGGMNWQRHFTDAIRGAMVEQIRGGAGLVWIGTGGNEVVDETKAHLLPVRGPATRRWTVFRMPSPSLPGAVPAEQSLARLIPLAEQLELLAYTHEETVGEAHIGAKVIVGPRFESPVLVTGDYGDARTVALTWDSVYYMGRPTAPGRLLPVFAGNPRVRRRDPVHRYWEDMYALLTRVVVWAARRDSPTRLLSAVADPREPTQLQVSIENPRDGCKLRVSWQDRLGVEVATSVTQVTETDVRATVPETVPAGPTYAHLFLRDSEGYALDWGSVPFQMVGRVRLVEVEQPRPFLPHGQVAEATAVVERDLPDLRCDARVTDGFGRELGRQNVAVPAGENPARVNLAFPTKHALGGQLRADLTFRTQDRSYAKRTITFGLTRVLPARGPRLVVWDMTLGSKQYYLNTHEARRALDLGMDAVLDGYHRTASQAYRAIVQGGVAFHPLNVLSIRDGAYHKKKSAYAKTGDKKHLIRKPCFDDHDDRAGLLKTFKEHCAPQLANGGALDYCLGDEMSLSHYADYSDFCFHPATLAKFREWLEGEYPSLDALNQEWDTSYTKWADVMPMTYKEARERENPAPWADFRTYMEIRFSGFLSLVQKTMAELDPRSHISLSGTQSPVAGNGMDWWRMSRAVPLFHSYNTSNMCQARRSFSPWQCDEPWFGGYWQEDPKLEWNMWWCLFHNCSGVSAWYTPIFFYPDFTYTTSGKQLRDHWRELKGGIWQQVRALQIDKPRVAVHYSQASIHATFIRGIPEAVHKAWDGWLRSLEDLAVPYDFISYEQVERGELERSGYRVLILPYSIALSNDEVAAISRFAAAGNRVIADVYPGITDEHCRPVSRESLSDLFGSERLGATPDGALDLRFGKDQVLRRLSPADGLRLVGAEPRGRSAIGDVPVLLGHRAGKGQAALLNFPVSFYTTERRVGEEAERVWRRLLGELLREAGVGPAAEIRTEGDSLSHVEVMRYTDGEGRPVLYGLLNSLIPGAKAQRMEIAFTGNASGFVYDVRTGRLISRSPRVAVVLRPGEPKLYAVLPRPVEAAGLPNGAARVGEEPALRFGFTGSGLSQAVRYEVTDSASRVRPEYSGVTVARRGRGEIRIPLAANDPIGMWTVRIRHVLTGVTAEGRLSVRP